MGQASGQLSLVQGGISEDLIPMARNNILIHVAGARNALQYITNSRMLRETIIPEEKFCTKSPLGCALALAKGNLY